MNCQEARDLVEDALDKRLSGGVKRRLDLHLARCRDCRRFYEAEQAEHTRWFRAMNDAEAEPPHPLPPDFADRLVAAVMADDAVNKASFFRRFHLPRWLKRAACFAVLLSGAAFAATVVVDAVVGSGGEGEGTEETQATEGTGGSAASAAPAEVVSDVPYVPDVASVPSTDPDNQQPANIHQPEGETKMTIKQKTVAALAAAATYCVALVSSANAEVYTWTGSASGIRSGRYGERGKNRLRRLVAGWCSYAYAPSFRQRQRHDFADVIRIADAQERCYGACGFAL